MPVFLAFLASMAFVLPAAELRAATTAMCGVARSQLDSAVTHVCRAPLLPVSDERASTAAAGAGEVNDAAGARILAH